MRFTPYYYTFKTLGLAAQAPLLSGILADVCGRPVQFVSSGYGAANETSVPGALRLAGVELPRATKLHVVPLSLAAITGLWRGRGGSLRQGDGPASQLRGCAAMAWWSLSPPGPQRMAVAAVSCILPQRFHTCQEWQRTGLGDTSGCSLSCASVSPLLPGVPQGSCSMEREGPLPPLRCRRGFWHRIWPPARLWLTPCVCPHRGLQQGLLSSSQRGF